MKNQILSLALIACSISNATVLSRVTKAIGIAATGTGLTSAYYFHRRKQFNEMKSGHDFWRDDYESSNTYDPKFEEMLAIGQSRIDQEERSMVGNVLLMGGATGLATGLATALVAVRMLKK